MLIHIDTAKDDLATLYGIGRWLMETYAGTAREDALRTESMVTVKVDTSEIQKIIDDIRDDKDTVAAPLPPPPPDVLPPNLGDAELDMESDEGGAIAAVTTTVELPPQIPAAPGAVPELDTRGIPWDGRVHASNRARKLDGSWKAKRGVGPALLASIEGQTTAPVPAGTAEVPAAPLAAAPPAPPPPPLAAPPAPAVPPPPLTTVGNVAPAAGAPAVSFREVMAKVGKLSPEQVVALLLPFGLKPEDMLDLVGNHALIASVNAAVDKLGV